jgi:hypothetical protein
MKSENESQGRKRLLASRQVGDILPTLLGRHDGEDDTLREGIRRVVELEFSVTAEGDHLPKEEGESEK